MNGHFSIGSDTMLKAEQLPAGVSELYSSLSDVERDNLTHSFLKLQQIIYSAISLFYI
jgi:hypothetical protein